MNKEIILELGWKHVGAWWYEWPVKDEIYVDEISSRTLDFKLNWRSEEESLKIEFYEKNYFEWYTGFEGPCRSKEELEYLMKLFNLIK